MPERQASICGAALRARLSAAPVPSPSSNHRTDQYGGSVESRARLVLEVVDAGIGEWGGGPYRHPPSPVGTFQNVDNGPNEEADAPFI